VLTTTTSTGIAVVIALFYGTLTVIANGMTPANATDIGIAY
jgi:hypothetical protein